MACNPKPVRQWHKRNYGASLRDCRRKGRQDLRRMLNWTQRRTPQATQEPPS